MLLVILQPYGSLMLWRDCFLLSFSRMAHTRCGQVASCYPPAIWITHAARRSRARWGTDVHKASQACSIPFSFLDALATARHTRCPQVAGALGADVREASEGCSKSVAALQSEIVALASNKADKVGGACVSVCAVKRVQRCRVRVRSLLGPAQQRRTWCAIFVLLGIVQLISRGLTFSLVRQTLIPEQA